MERYLRILQPTKVYSKHSSIAREIKTLEPDTIISFNREKRRDKVNWMEIYLENKEVAYIKKNSVDFYKCEDVELDDDYSQGFNFTYKNEENPTFGSIFFQEGTTDIINIGNIKAECVEDSEKDKKHYVSLDYDKDLVEVNPISLNKGEQFYVINNVYGKSNIFIEIDNFKGKKGFILKKSSYVNKGDKWIQPFSIVIMIVVIGGLILAGLSAGWLVISGLMIIPAIIVALVAVFAIQIAIMILKGIFNMIRKRL